MTRVKDPAGFMNPENFSSEDPNAMQCWPLRSFAPGYYCCKCSTCKRSFLGDKRAGECLECAIKGVKGYAAKANADREGMAEELQKADIAIANPVEHIVAAAIFHHGCTISLPQPARHGQVLISMNRLLGIDTVQVPPENQGFLTSFGRFVNRIEAKQIAYRAKQEIRESGNKGAPELYSEDLW